MPQLSVYPSTAEFPTHLAYQAHAFIRITWFDIYQYDIHAPMTPDEWHPTHIAVSEASVLMAYGAAVWKNLDFAGQTYKCYGLSGIHTYPAFRKRGYGTQVVKTATEHICQDPAADIALLWTDPNLTGFYGQFGWEATPDITIHLGDEAQPRIDDGYYMMLFLSERAKAERATFSQHPIYFGDGSW
jgi:GNAT superfamily N-acetyltransferase